MLTACFSSGIRLCAEIASFLYPESDYFSMFEGWFEGAVTPDYFLNNYVTCLEIFIRSFNPNDFPDKTLFFIGTVLNYKKDHFSHILFNNQQQRVDLQDLLIDFEQQLTKFKAEIESGKLALARQRKDFVEARKQIYPFMQKIISDSEESSLVRLVNFQRLKKVFGL